MDTYGRIYKNFSFIKLLRLKSFFLTCRFPFVVSNLGSIYQISTRVLGKKLVNGIIKTIYGDIFLAGENSRDLEKLLKQLNQQGVITIADYAREFLTKEEEEREIGEIIKHYKESIDASIRTGGENSIAMKISSFADVDSLKLLNQYQYALLVLEENLDKNYQQLLDLLEHNKLDLRLNHSNYEKLKRKHGEVFSLNLYKILLSNDEENVAVMKSLLGLTSRQYNELKKCTSKLDERLMQVFSHAEKSKCLIMVDAEQSYLKYISDMIVVHYFMIFNKNSCTLAQTLQCYLKTQPQELKKWHEFTQKYNLKLGLKIVRGAYMNEEEKIARRKGVESNICEGIQTTHSQYDKSIEFLFENYKPGDKFCIATHNIDSIKLTAEMYRKKGVNENIFCAQLLGIAEHATGYCRKHEVKVAKYVPFGNFEILIPYLIRRAEESSMIQKLSVQNDLLNREIMTRLHLVKNQFPDNPDNGENKENKVI